MSSGSETVESIRTRGGGADAADVVGPARAGREREHVPLESLARPAWRPDRHRAFEHDQPLLLAEVPVIGADALLRLDQVDRAAELGTDRLRERPLPVPEPGSSVPSVQSSS